jgi:thiol-disulfide isomerase/thioredoxin
MEYTMNRKISCLITVILALFMATAISAAENGTPKVGSAMPDLELQMLNNPADLQYLGLPAGGKSYRINQVKAKVVIIQIYSMYCPYCQAEAPNVNRLYAAIENNPALKDKIKIIAIGAGNTQFEVATYKKKYAVPLPLVPDENFKIHKIVGEVRTPYFIAVKLNNDGKTEVIYSRLGALGNVDVFLAQLVTLSGLK